MEKNLKDIVYEVIETYYNFEKKRRQEIGDSLSNPFNGIDVTNMQQEIFKIYNRNETWGDIARCANALVQEGKAKYVAIYQAYTSINAPN